MNEVSGVLRYLAECYRENGSRIGITSLESSRVRQSLILSGEDPVLSRAVLDGLHFVPGKRAADLGKQAKLYEKDRDLFFGAVFYVGMVERNEARKKPAFAPLILYPASVTNIIDDSGAEFTIDTNRALLNDALLSDVGSPEFVAKVESAIELSGHSEGGVGELRRLFRDELPDVDTEKLFFYPQLQKSKELREVYTAIESGEDKTAHLLPGVVLFLADKSTEMRGVLNDLEEMATSDSAPGAPASQLLGLNPGSPTRNRKRGRGHIPASLSPAQEKIVASAGEAALTLAVGPPGTGKSFTIAALAVEAMSRGESVLIASKMDHAVDVVADKIEESIGLRDVCVRAGRKSYLKDLKRFLENLLSGMYFHNDITGKAVKASEIRLKVAHREMLRLEESLKKRCAREEAWGEILSRPSPSFFTRWRQKRIRNKTARETLSCTTLASRVREKVDELISLNVEHLQLVRKFHLSAASVSHRGTFQSFSRGIRARTTHKKEDYFASVDWSGLLRGLPVWLINLSDLHRIIPMQRELFDLVIIDEASQCDIASALPALHRAKRAVITGDPKQLRHVSFLSRASQADFACQFGLDETVLDRFNFRNVSLVDLASVAIQSKDSVVFLNEHFRSRPEIIGFSNEAFYAGKLAIMTGHRDIDHDGEEPISLLQVDGQRHSGSGINQMEIDAILASLEQILGRAGRPLSIGILSPFRAQVDAILRHVEKHDALHALLNRHDLLVGTAHSFQGEERDIMLLSFVVDDDSPSASFRFLEKEDVFNVAITRARLENRIFLSFREAPGVGGLLSRFLGYAKASKNLSKRPKRVRSSTQPCLLALCDQLESEGWELIEDFRIGDYSVDLLCKKEGRTLGIDLIGFRGAHAEAMALDRHLMLKRAGIELVPIPFSEWEVIPDRVTKFSTYPGVQTRE